MGKGESFHEIKVDKAYMQIHKIKNSGVKIFTVQSFMKFTNSEF